MHRYHKARDRTMEVAIMAPTKEGGRARHKESTGPRKRERTQRVVEQDARLGREAAVVEVDLWGSFFETFWEQTEGESVGRHESERKPAKGTRTTRRKSDRQERSPRAS